MSDHSCISTFLKNPWAAPKIRGRAQGILVALSLTLLPLFSGCSDHAGTEELLSGNLGVRIEVSGGNNQVGTPDRVFQSDIYARVIDPVTNTPIENVLVEFTLIESISTVEIYSPVVDANRDGIVRTKVRAPSNPNTEFHIQARIVGTNTYTTFTLRTHNNGQGTRFDVEVVCDQDTAEGAAKCGANPNIGVNKVIAGVPIKFLVKVLDFNGFVVPQINDTKTLIWRFTSWNSWGGYSPHLPAAVETCEFINGVCTLRASSDPNNNPSASFELTDSIQKTKVFVGDGDGSLEDVFAKEVTVLRDGETNVMLADRLGGPTNEAKPWIKPAEKTAFIGWDLLFNADWPNTQNPGPFRFVPVTTDAVGNYYTDVTTTPGTPGGATINWTMEPQTAAAPGSNERFNGVDVIGPYFRDKYTPLGLDEPTAVAPTAIATPSPQDFQYLATTPAESKPIIYYYPTRTGRGILSVNVKGFTGATGLPFGPESGVTYQRTFHIDHGDMSEAKLSFHVFETEAELVAKLNNPLAPARLSSTDPEHVALDAHFDTQGLTPIYFIAEPTDKKGNKLDPQHDGTNYLGGGGSLNLSWTDTFDNAPQDPTDPPRMSRGVPKMASLCTLVNSAGLPACNPQTLPNYYASISANPIYQNGIPVSAAAFKAYTTGATPITGKMPKLTGTFQMLGSSQIMQGQTEPFYVDLGPPAAFNLYKDIPTDWPGPSGLNKSNVELAIAAITPDYMLDIPNMPSWMMTATYIAGESYGPYYFGLEDKGGNPLGFYPTVPDGTLFNANVGNTLWKAYETLLRIQHADAWAPDGNKVLQFKPKRAADLHQPGTLGYTPGQVDITLPANAVSSSGEKPTVDLKSEFYSEGEKLTTPHYYLLKILNAQTLAPTDNLLATEQHRLAIAAYDLYDNPISAPQFNTYFISYKTASGASPQQSVCPSPRPTILPVLPDTVGGETLQFSALSQENSYPWGHLYSSSGHNGKFFLPNTADHGLIKISLIDQNGITVPDGEWEKDCLPGSNPNCYKGGGYTYPNFTAGTYPVAQKIPAISAGLPVEMRLKAVPGSSNVINSQLNFKAGDAKDITIQLYDNSCNFVSSPKGVWTLKEANGDPIVDPASDPIFSFGFDPESSDTFSGASWLTATAEKPGTKILNSTFNTFSGSITLSAASGDPHHFELLPVGTTLTGNYPTIPTITVTAGTPLTMNAILHDSKDNNYSADLTIPALSIRVANSTDSPNGNAIVKPTSPAAYTLTGGTFAAPQTFIFYRTDNAQAITYSFSNNGTLVSGALNVVVNDAGAHNLKGYQVSPSFIHAGATTPYSIDIVDPYGNLATSAQNNIAISIGYTSSLTNQKFWVASGLSGTPAECIGGQAGCTSMTSVTMSNTQANLSLSSEQAGILTIAGAYVSGSATLANPGANTFATVTVRPNNVVASLAWNPAPSLTYPISLSAGTTTQAPMASFGVLLKDAYGNTIDWDANTSLNSTGSISLSVVGGSALSLGGTPSKNIASGAVSFADIAYPRAEIITLRAIYNPPSALTVTHQIEQGPITVTAGTGPTGILIVLPGETPVFGMPSIALARSGSVTPYSAGNAHPITFYAVDAGVNSLTFTDNDNNFRVSSTNNSFDDLNPNNIRYFRFINGISSAVVTNAKSGSNFKYKVNHDIFAPASANVTLWETESSPYTIIAGTTTKLLIVAPGQGINSGALSTADKYTSSPLLQTAGTPITFTAYATDDYYNIDQSATSSSGPLSALNLTTSHTETPVVSILGDGPLGYGKKFSALHTITRASIVASLTGATALTKFNSDAFTIAPSTATQLGFPGGAGNPSVLRAAGAAFTRTINIWDAYGNTRAADSGALITLAPYTDAACATLATGATIAGGTLTAANGVASSTGLWINQVGTYYFGARTGTLSACSGVATLTQTVNTVTVTPAGAATHYSTLNIQGSPTVTVHSSNKNGQVRVHLADQYGNTIGSAASTITLGLSPSSGTATNSPHCTFVSGGDYDCFIGRTLVGPLTISMSKPTALTTLPAVTLTFVHGDPAKISFSSPTATTISVTAGTAFSTQPKIAIQDAYGNLIGEDSTTAISLGLSTLSNCSTDYTTTSLTGTTLVSASSGTATFTNIGFNNVLNGNGRIFIKASSDTLGTACSGATSTYTVYPGAINVLTFTAPTAGQGTIAAGNAFTSQPKVELRDAYGNTATNAVNTTVTLGAYDDSACTSSVAGTFVGNTHTLAASFGIATFTAAKFSKVPTSSIIYLKGSSGAVTACNGQPITLSPNIAAASTQSTITPTTATVAAGTTSTLTITIKDTYGNTVPGATVSTTMTGARTGLAACSSVTGTDGTTTCDTTSTISGLVTIALAQPTFASGGGKATFTYSAAGADHLSFPVPSAGISVTAGAVITGPAKVDIRDQYNNIVTSGAYPITMNAYTVAGCTSLGAGTLSGKTVTSSSGLANFSSLYYTKAEVIYLHAETSGLASTNTICNAYPITIGNAAASGTTSTIVGPGSAITVGNPAAVTITLKDTYGNAVGNTTPVFNASGTGNSGYTCGATNTTTGAASCSMQSTIAGTKNLTITSPAIGVSSANAVTFLAGNAAALSFSAPTSNQTNMTAGSAFGTQPKVTVLDSYGNTALATGANLPITLAAFSTAGCGSAFAGTLPNNTVTSDSNAVASFTGVSFDKVGNVYLKATSDTLTAGCAAYYYGIVPAAPVSMAWSHSAISSVTAGATISPYPQVTVYDTYGNTANNASTLVTLAAYEDSGCSTTPTTLNGTKSVAVSSGIATFSNVNHTTAHDIYLQATSPAGSQLCTPVITIGPAAPNATQSSITATSPVTVNGNVNIGSTIAVTLRDTYGNLTPGYAVTIGGTGPGGSASRACGTTGASGDTTCKYNAMVSGTYTISVSSPIAITGVPVEFLPGAASQIGFYTTNPTAYLPGTMSAGAAFSPAPRVAILDTYSNVVTTAGSDLTLSAHKTTDCSDAAQTFIGGTQTLAASSGIATFSDINYTKAETIFLKASGLTGITACSYDIFSSGTKITPASASADTSTIVGPGASVQAGQFADITVTLKDAFGNTIGGQTPVFSASGSGNSNYNCGASVTATGAAACSMKSTLVGTKDLFLTSPVSVSGGAVTYIAASAAQLLLTSALPSGTTAGYRFSPQPHVQVADAYGNSVASSIEVVAGAFTNNSCSANAPTTLRGTVTLTTAADGTAAFTDLNYEKNASSIYLGISSAGLTTACTSGTISLSAAPGTLDETFGASQNGIITFSPGTTDLAQAVVGDGSNNIYVAGKSDNNIIVKKFDSNGTAVGGFGTSGTVTIPLGADVQVRSAVISGANLIVAATSGGVSSIVIAPVALTDGTPGTPITLTGTSMTAINAIAIDATNSMVFAAGSTAGNEFGVEQYSYGGTPGIQAGFGSSGLATTAFGSGDASANAIALHSDGKIIVAGKSSGHFAVARFLSTGSLDTAFSTDGMDNITIGTASEVKGIALDTSANFIGPDYGIVLVGRSTTGATYTFAATVLNSTAGSIISGSTFTLTGAGASVTANSVIMDGQNYIIGGLDNNGDFALMRMTNSGVLDTTSFTGFGLPDPFSEAVPGYSTTHLGGTDEILSMAILNGKLVVVGRKDSDFGIARYFK